MDSENQIPPEGRRRWWPFVVALAAIVLAVAVGETVDTYVSGPAPLVQHVPRQLVRSPFALGSGEGALIAGMNEQLAANAASTGQVIGPDYNAAALASQAPGREAVTLRRPGQYVQFTVRAQANAIDVSYALRPGASSTLTIEVNGTRLSARLALSSPSSYAADDDGTGGRLPQYFSDARILLGRQLKPGDTVRLAEATATATIPCTIAVADFYQVPAAAAQPPSSVSVVALGADPTGRRDSEQAFARAIHVADAEGQAVWIPRGTFLLSSPLQATSTTIIGAGSWYSLIRTRQFLDNPAAVRGPVNLSGFAVEGPGGGNAERGAAISGSLGQGSVVNGLWIQGTAGGLALTTGDDYATVENSQILSTQADGVAIGPGVFGAWVKNNLIRNSGGDGVALQSDSNTTVSNNTIVEPVIGGGIAEYGGADNKIISNVVADTHASGSGIEVTDPSAAPATAQSSLAGVITVADNAVLRCGSAGLPTGVPFAAVAVDSGSKPVSKAAINFASDHIDDSPYSAIEIGTSRSSGASQPVSGVTFDGDSISGTGAVAVETRTSGSATFSDVTGTAIGVVGSFQSAPAAGGSHFSFRLGHGNAGWSVTPVLSNYPRHVGGSSHPGRPRPTGPSSPSPTPRGRSTPPPFPSPLAPPTPTPTPTSPSKRSPAPGRHRPPTTNPPSTIPPITIQPTTNPPTTNPPTTIPPTTNPPTINPPTTEPSASPQPAPRLSESASAVAPGASVSIKYSAPTAYHHAWVGIYPAGQRAGRVLPPCAHKVSAASGTFTCNTSSLDGPGSYNVYYGYGYGPSYHRLAGPLALTVTGTRSALSESAGTVRQGASVQISYRTPNANYNNWIGVYPYGKLASGGEWRSFQWAVDASGSVTLDTGSLSPGKYYVYLNYNDSYRVLAAPLTLTVTSS